MKQETVRKIISYLSTLILGMVLGILFVIFKINESPLLYLIGGFISVIWILALASLNDKDKVEVIKKRKEKNGKDTRFAS